jgi:molybdopterin synthase sulfur carrier subunit
MSIKVRYFASLKERVGQSETELELHAPLSARNIWLRLHPDLPPAENLLAAVNMEYVTLDTMVNDGDELAFFPPVTGG